MKEILPVVLLEMYLDGFVLPHPYLNLTVNPIYFFRFFYYCVAGYG